MTLSCFFWPPRHFTVHKQFLGKKVVVGCSVISHFLKEGLIKQCSTCPSPNGEDMESLRTMAGMVNFWTYFELQVRNFDLSLTMLSIIHLQSDSWAVNLELSGNSSTFILNNSPSSFNDVVFGF